MNVKNKRIILIILVLVLIIPMYRLLQRIEINYYFITHYNQSKYEIRLTDYYESGNLSGITDIVEEYGVTFPGYVYIITPTDNSIEDIPETDFYIGANGFKIWDTYEVVQLEYRLDKLVDDILSHINGIVDSATHIRISDEELKNKDQIYIDKVYKILKVEIKCTEVNKEKLIETLKDMNRSLEENSIYINRFKVSVCVGEDSRAYWFDHEELNREDLMKILDET